MNYNIAICLAVAGLLCVNRIVVAAPTSIVPPHLDGKNIGASVSASVEYIPSSQDFHYAYVVGNISGSKQQIGEFAIEKGVKVYSAVSPQGWTGGAYKREPLWSWFPTNESSGLKPGQKLAGFGLSSKGLPGLKNYYAQGDFPTPSIYDIPESVSEEEFTTALDVTHNGIKGTTFGPSDVYLDAPIPQLINYIADQKHRAYSIGWIDNQGIVTSLDKKLDAALDSYNRGQLQVAKNQLRAFQSELSAQRDKHVKLDAVSLLSTCAEAVISRL